MQAANDGADFAFDSLLKQAFDSEQREVSCLGPDCPLFCFSLKSGTSRFWGHQHDSFISVLVQLFVSKRNNLGFLGNVLIVF